MNKIATKLDGVYIIEPKVHGDSRGWFLESYSRKTFADLGFDYTFIQDNHSYSAQKGIIRGIHFQNNPCSQTKLVRCVRGGVLDVAVDLRKGSPTYRQWIAVELTGENKKMLLIPQGFGHGFATLTENVEFMYKVDSLYSPETDRGIRFDDPAIGVDWGIENPVLSAKDQNAPLLVDSDCNYVYGGGI